LVGVGLAVAVGLALWAWSRSTGDAGQQLGRGLTLLAKNETREAYKIARQLQANPASVPQGDLLAGAILLQSGQFEPALQTLVGPSKNDATATMAYTLSAEAYYKLGRWGEAVLASQEALKREPDNLMARRWLAAGAYDLGSVGMAAEELLKLAEADPKDGRANRLLGLIEKDREQFAPAVDFYRESLRRQPEAPDRGEILEELGDCLVKLNRFDEALAALEELPETVGVLNLRATCQAGLGEAEAQSATLARARELEPTHLKTLVASAARATADGDLDGAIVWLSAAVEHHPHDSQSHYLLAQALERSGEGERAKEQFRLFEQWQAVEQEFTELHNTASAEVSNAKLRLRLGDLALKLAKPELAGTWYRAALALDPRLEGARRGLEKVERTRGR
jgi:tetratricopeptide (TPR) repeat protein